MPDRSFAELGVALPQILLPKDRASLRKWCVVACDQYTSDRAYWAHVEQTVGEAPSTYHMVLPEVYLHDDDVDARAQHAANAMQFSLTHGVLEALAPGFVLVQRRFTCHDRCRTGLVMALDLEQYDYRPGATSLIRATEGTIPARIPPRLRIRRRAKLELPHIMVLIDDPDHTVIEPLAAQKQALPKLYDSELDFALGRIEGYFISQTRAEQVRQALSALYDRLQVQQGEHPMLFAMGDGNHSLATAKAYWEEVKQTLPPQAQATHPARYALCEVVNIHDAGLAFEAIHRVLFHAGGLDAVYRACQALQSQGVRVGDAPQPGAQAITLVCDGQSRMLYVTGSPSFVESGTADALIDAICAFTPQAEVDYIHGEAEARALCRSGGHVGFLVPALQKADLFGLVSQNGPLPRKAFSMGEADEKRCYLEARLIDSAGTLGI